MKVPPTFDPGLYMPECTHERSQVRMRTIRGGSTQFVEQCLECGKAISNPISKDRVRGSPPPFDDGLIESYKQRRDDWFQSQRAERSAQFWAEYSAYLKSPEWRAKRRAVLLRAQGLCEGCRAQPATQVHHLTYKRVGREMLFDLVAVCDSCHEQVHEEGEDG